MVKYLLLWRRNDLAPWPNKSTDKAKFAEKLWLGIDILMKKGMVRDHGCFLDGKEGFTIVEGKPVDIFRHVRSVTPFFEFEVKEIIPHNETKEVVRALYARSQEPL